MRSILWTIYFLAFHTGIIDLFYRRNRRRVVAVTFHNVLPDRLVDDSPYLRMCHRESSFVRQMEIIARRWPPAAKDSDSTCLVTFDDGYRNNYLIAAPILERYGYRGVFFVSLDLVANGNLLWPDRFMTWLSLVPAGKYALLGRVAELHDNESRAVCWEFLWNEIVTDYGCLDAVREALEDAFPFDRLPIDSDIRLLRLEGMTPGQLAQLSSRHHRIACHSYRHDILACLPDEALDEDFDKCEKALGTFFNCALYAYPFGGPEEVTERVRDACARSRFELAFLNIDFPDRDTREDRYAMRRIMLPDTRDRYVIEAKLSGFESFLKGVVTAVSPNGALSRAGDRMRVSKNASA